MLSIASLVILQFTQDLQLIYCTLCRVSNAINPMQAHMGYTACVASCKALCNIQIRMQCSEKGLELH